VTRVSFTPSSVSNLPLSFLVDLDETRGEQAVAGNCASVCEWTSALCDGGDGEAVQEVLLEGEEGVECDDGALDLDVLELLNDGGVLLVDVDEGNAVPVVLGVVGVGTLGDDTLAGKEGLDVEAELEGLVLGVNDLGVEVEDAEDLEVDHVGVGARVGDNETLVQCREGKVTGAGGEEWLGVGDLLL